MRLGRPRKIGVWTARLIRLYKHLGYDMETLTKRFKISQRTVYRYIAKGGYNVNDKKKLHKNSQSNSKP